MSEENFTTHYFDRVTSNANVNYPVIATRSADKNSARPLHLYALLDQDALVRVGHSVCYHPRSSASRRRPRSRIFSVLEDHSRVQAGRWIDRFTGHEIQEFSARFIQVVADLAQLDPQVLNHRQRFQRSYGVRKSCRYGLNRQRSMEILHAQSCRSRPRLAIVLHSKFRIDLRHLSKRRLPRRVFETHRNLSDVQLESDFLRPRFPSQCEGRAQRGMARER